MKAGRKRKNPDARRIPVCFSLDPSMREKLAELRHAGVMVNEYVEREIARLHDTLQV